MTAAPSDTGAPPYQDADPGTLLVERLSRLRHDVALLVDARSSGDPTAADPLRGLYVSDEAVRRLLRPARVQDPADDAGAPEPDGDADGSGGGHDVLGAQDAMFGDAGARGDRLGRLAARLGLSRFDAGVLLAAAAPDLDRGFEQLYGYLNDDVSRRRATVGLAIDLCGLPVHLAEARARFHPEAPLIAFGLLTVEEPERPFLSRSLRVPDRVTAHLLGDDMPQATLTDHLRPPGPPRAPADEASAAFVERLAGLLASDPAPAVHVREENEGDGLGYVSAALAAAGVPALCFSGPADLLPDVLREARLRGRAIVVSALPDEPAELVRTLVGAADVPLVLIARRAYDPRWCEQPVLAVEAPRPSAGAALAAWSAALDDEEPGFDLAATVAPYRFSGDAVVRVAHTARALAAFENAPLGAAHLRLAARQQTASGLEQHARRIRPAVDWDDLVLPAKPLAQLGELALRARHRERVLGDWRLSAGGGRGRGVLGLFAGPSGTGKTLSAEVVAAELGLDLYVVQLSSVVDKYVGETEKNLERIFTEADRTDAVLLFDEADAVFGKRSEVKDAHDRYANLESAYLLQRLESFDGVALLTTNLRANIDEAFTRRLDLVVDFPFPDGEQRLSLWRHSLSRVPAAESLALQPLADGFELAGGAIRSAVVTAAYLAAGRGTPVTGDDLLEGARREYRKAGRLVPGEGSW